MSNLALLAYHHGHRYSGGWTDSLAHRTVSAVVHGLIYGVVFRLVHRLTLGEAVVLTVVVLAALFMWGRSRDRRGC